MGGRSSQLLSDAAALAVAGAVRLVTGDDRPDQPGQWRGPGPECPTPQRLVSGCDATRRRLIFVAKLGLGIGLMTWLLLWNDNWRQVLRLFADTRPAYLLPFIAIMIALIGASCLKWRLFLHERGARISFGRLFGLYLIGIFFNNFLPSNFGGDVMRAYYLGRQIASHAQSLASVFLERLTGLIALVTLALAACVFTPELQERPLVGGSILVLAAGCVALVIALWHPSLVGRLLGPFRRIGTLERLVTKLHAFHGQVFYFRSKPFLVVKAMAYSFLFHGGTVLNVYLATLVLGLDLSLAKLFVVTPIILVIAALPLTPNSLGVWEWAFGVYLIPAGAALEQGLAVALLLRAQTLATSLLGGALFLIEGRNVRRGGIVPES